MKTVAIIAPDFPPCGLPSSLRVRSFASNLKAHGWNPIVITTDPRHYVRPLDRALERLLPSDLEVIRTGAIPAGLARRVGIGDMGIRSFWQHWRALSQLCREQPVDLVLISVPPSLSMLLGRLAWERFGIPYVIDYMDPWRAPSYRHLPRHQRPPKWHLADWTARLLEPLAIKNAAHLVAVSEGTARAVLANYPGLDTIPSEEIPFGVDPADFEFLRTHPRSNPVFDPADGLWHFTYTGAFIQPMENALRALLTAVRDGMATRPELFGRLRLHFVGTTYAPRAAGPGRVSRIAAEMGLGAFVTELPSRVSYLDSLQIALDSQGLLLLGSEEPHYSPSKAFTYLAACRPIFALCHAVSNVVPILRGAAGVRIVTFTSQQPLPGSKAAIRNALTGMLALPRDFRTAAEGRLAGWTASDMAGRLAYVFDRVCCGARSPAVVARLQGVAS